MAVMRPNGEAAEFPTGARRRGPTLSDASVRRLRDLLYIIMIRFMGLSPADVDKVFRTHVRERQLYVCLNRCSMSRAEVANTFRTFITVEGSVYDFASATK